MNKAAAERAVDEPLPPDTPRQSTFRGPCLLCGQQVAEPGDGLCDDCDNDLAEESSR